MAAEPFASLFFCSIVLNQAVCGVHATTWHALLERTSGQRQKSRSASSGEIRQRLQRRRWAFLLEVPHGNPN
uniref:Putative secreted protein n=1 Tax=Anopheles darlingi TaxID=43151 RepID=A0A2M4DE21_ANODA